MSHDTQSSVIHTLETLREEITHRLTEVLFERVPVVGISDTDKDPVTHHHHNMALTANRFHEIVQAGSIDWTLVSSEFGWADRKLSTMGVTHEHHQVLVDCYFEEAHKLHDWTDEERDELNRIAANLRKAVAKAYEQQGVSA